MSQGLFLARKSPQYPNLGPSLRFLVLISCLILLSPNQLIEKAMKDHRRIILEHRRIIVGSSWDHHGLLIVKNCPKFPWQCFLSMEYDHWGRAEIQRVPRWFLAPTLGIGPSTVFYLFALAAGSLHSSVRPEDRCHANRSSKCRRPQALAKLLQRSSGYLSVEDSQR